MGFVSLASLRTRSSAQADARRMLKALLAEALALERDDTVTVNEIACADPGCPERETIVLIMRRGEPTRALRIRRPLADVDAADVLALVTEERARRLVGSS